MLIENGKEMLRAFDDREHKSQEILEATDGVWFARGVGHSNAIFGITRFLVFPAVYNTVVIYIFKECIIACSKRLRLYYRRSKPKHILKIHHI